MEPRAAVASFDAATGDYTLYTTSQNPHLVRAALCNVVPGLVETQLRVISPDVGGGFGSKAPVYPEETVLTWLAGRLDCALRWTSDRSEAFLTDVQGRDHESVAELALDRDGQFLALRVRTLANIGAYLSSGTTAIPTYYYAPLLAGPYRTPAIHCNVMLCFTHTTSVDAYRGAGRPEASYLLERLIDKAAHETGHDRVELRRRNFIGKDEFPYLSPLGLEYDSGDHHATLALALEAAEWSSFAERKRLSRQKGLLRGIGLSTYVEIAGGTPSRMLGQIGGRGGRSESAQIRVHPSGTVTVFSGVHSHGQGHETTFAQIVAERLGIAFEHVKIVQGDTDRIPFGRGTIASRSLVVGGSAIIAGLDKIITKARKIAAHLLETAHADITFENGRFQVIGTDRSIGFREVARAAYLLHEYPIAELEPGLDETAFYDPKNWTFPGGCHICELEVDP
jgi:carbon-monoxide dehydrogenase large subunit